MLNYGHGLLDGLQGFWLPVHGRAGGSRLYDLSSVGQHGNLIDASFESREEGIGIITGSSNTTVNFGVIDALTGGGGKSYLAYLYIPSGTTSGRSLFRVPSSNDGSRLIFLQEGFGKADDQFTIDINNENRAASDLRLNLGEFNTVGAAIPSDNLPDSTIFVNGVKAQSYDAANPGGEILDTAANDAQYRDDTPFTVATAVFDRVITETDAKIWDDQARRGFPDLLNRRDSVGLLGGGLSSISGTAAITDAQEQISATGQTEVSGILSVTDGSETLTINGAMKVSGTASITEAAEQISGAGSVITTGSLSITDSGEIISAVSSLQDITGTAQITDSAEEVEATGEVKIAGTASLADGTEEIIIVGKNDISGAVSFADLAAEIAAKGAVEVQGSLALTDAGESITARERVPARLASVDVRLEDIIVVHATLEDTLTLDAKLTD